MDKKESLTCRDCDKRESCNTLCRAIQLAIHEPGAVYERGNAVMPERNNVIQFSVLGAHALEQGDPDTFTEEDRLQLNSDALELRSSVVFFEHFFNGTSLSELAERMNTSYGNVWLMYREACERIEFLATMLDLRMAAMKLARKGNLNKFSYDQKVFLLSHVFGFSLKEVSTILGQYSQAWVKRKAQRMEKKYRAAFEAAAE